MERRFVSTFAFVSGGLAIISALMSTLLCFNVYQMYGQLFGARDLILLGLSLWFTAAASFFLQLGGVAFLLLSVWSLVWFTLRHIAKSTEPVNKK